MGKLVYIAGYGRSGSTVLGTLLGSHPRMCHVGEATFFPQDAVAPERICSCKKHYCSCPFWQPVVEENDLVAANNATRNIEDILALPKLLLGLVSKTSRDTYRQFAMRMFQHVRHVKGADMIVDSSKTARTAVGRPLALSRFTDEDVYVIHLVRNGLATMESVVMKGSNRELEGQKQPRHGAPALHAAVGWLIANVTPLLLKLALPRDRYIRVRYEDFIQHPARELERLGQFLDVDLSDVAEKAVSGDAFDVGHSIGGNRLRLAGTVRLKRVAPAGHKLPRRHLLVYLLTCGMLHKMFGYPFRSPRSAGVPSHLGSTP